MSDITVLDLGVEYQVSMADVGWGPWVRNGKMAGTKDECRQLEAIRFRLINKGNLDIELLGQPHVQNLGWTGFVKENEVMGTTGKGLSLQACQFALRGKDAAKYAAQYRMSNVQDIGPMDWVTNEELAGTTSGDKRAEAFEMMITEAGVDLGNSKVPGYMVLEMPKPPVIPPSQGAVGSGDIGVFFSPSKQPDNIYLVSGISEQQYCEDLVANYIIPELVSRGGRGYTLNSGGVQNGERNNYCDQLYTEGKIAYSIPIHTNAGGGQGCEIFCNPDTNSVGYKLANNILSNILKLGRPSRGLKDASAAGLYEYTVDAPVAYIEIDFHDSQAGCDFLLNNKKNLAVVIVNGIYAQANVSPVIVTPTVEPISSEMLTEHFARSEFACDCGGRYCNGFPVEMNMDLVNRMEQMRQILDVPVNVTSGVRCEQRNAEVGGVPNSKHKRGLAVDCYINGMNADKVRLISQTAQQCGMDTIEYYDQLFVHCEI
jgi:uncharacterized protein YjdB